MQTSIVNYITTKYGYMPQLELKQLQYEADSWKRLLGFMREENIHLKSRLSEVLRDNYDKRLLINAEEFQTEFINKDELFGLLRNETAALEKLFVVEIFKDGVLKKEIERKFKNLRNDISCAEDDFRKMKSEFNNYLSGNSLKNEH